MTFTTPIHTNEQSIDRVLRAGLPVMLVFWRNDCPPCQQLDPILDRLAAIFTGKALIAKVNVGENPALARRYSITQLPGLVFVKDGRAVGQGHGAAMEATLRAWFDHLITGGSRPANPSGPSISLDGAATTTSTKGPAAGTTYANETAAHQPTSEAVAGPITLSDATFNQVVSQSAKPVLVDFWAPWCGPCRTVAPAIEQLAREFAGRAVVAKLNVDDNPRTTDRFDVRGTPALLIFKRGQVVERLVGAQPAAVLRQALAKHAG